MLQKQISSIVALCIVLLCGACTSKPIFDSELDIKDAEWNLHNRASFSVNITDTLYSHDIYVSIENSDEYYYSNLYLFTQILMPNKKVIIDTLELILADDRGEFTGKRSVNGYKNVFPFKQNIRFPATGNYVFKFEQAMRCDESGNLVGISNVGMQIIKK